ncbi:MAG: type II secretion system protein GspM [Thalassovita sp.]
MNDRLITFFLSLNPRERILLALVTFIVLPLGLVFGVLLPLVETRQQAQHDLLQAQALQFWVHDRAAEAGSYTGDPSQIPGPPIGLAAIEQSLLDAKLRAPVTSLAAQANGGVEMVFEQVDFVRFANWLSSGHPGWGYDLVSYRIEATETPGRVAVTLVLGPR